MSGETQNDALLREWDEHLRAELAATNRAYTFDMEEKDEQAHLAHFPLLAAATGFYDSEVKPAYDTADAAALTLQKTHRRLACVAIIGGSLAISFAILQLALQHSRMVGLLEAVAVLSGVTAVIVGFVAKVNHQWFIQRHIAERLRMLKFQALGRPEFWCGDFEKWKAWMRGERDAIHRIATIEEVTDWEKSGAAEPFEPPAPTCSLSAVETRAAAIYYRCKRVGCQAGYFKKQSVKFAAETRWLHRLSFPIFAASIVAVVLHFATEFVSRRLGDLPAAHAWEAAGMWALACAALLPVLGFGVRAWIGAFERTRSSHLFEDKHRGLMKTFKDMARDEGDCAVTMHHIAHVEHFLENEHREWLRLLLDAEWFL